MIIEHVFSTCKISSKALEESVQIDFLNGFLKLTLTIVQGNIFFIWKNFEWTNSHRIRFKVCILKVEHNCSRPSFVRIRQTSCWISKSKFGQRFRIKGSVLHIIIKIYKCTIEASMDFFIHTLWIKSLK